MFRSGRPGFGCCEVSLCWGSAVLRDTNAAQLKAIFNLAGTTNFHRLAVSRFAGEFARAFGNKSAEGQDLLEPLVADLIVCQSFGEILGDRDHSFVFAINLPQGRATFWKNNLGNFLKNQQNAKNNGDSEFTIGQNRPIRLSQAGTWFVVSGGVRNANVERSYLDALKKSNLPTLPLQGNWFEADVDWVRLPEYLPFKPEFLKPCRTEIALGSKNNNIRANVKAIYPQKLNWKPLPWIVPTNLIGSPNYLVGFTAARNISPFANVPANFKNLPINPYTNQVFLWNHPDLPLQVYGAMPVSNGKESLQKMGSQIPPVFNPVLKSNQVGSIGWNSNKTSLVWKGLSITTPEMIATNVSGHDFLAAGFFPFAALRTNTASPLWGEVVNKSNLVYYDWEITEARMGSWLFLSQLVPLVPTVHFEPGKRTCLLLLQSGCRLSARIWKIRLPRQPW